MRLQLGCGLTRPTGWINSDSSLNSLVQRIPGFTQLMGAVGRTKYASAAEYIDVRRRWPIDDRSVDIVYASHLFEHLTHRDGDHFLREAGRVLRPRGVLRLVVPDLHCLAKRYVQALEGGDASASEPFLYALNLHLEGTYDPGANYALKILHWFQGYPHQHKYMYDSASISRRLLKAGFDAIRFGSYGESEYIPEIRDVEHTAEGQPSIYVEAKR